MDRIFGLHHESLDPKEGLPDLKTQTLCNPHWASHTGSFWTSESVSAWLGEYILK